MNTLNMKKSVATILKVVALGSFCFSNVTNAAIALDRTRAIFNSTQKSASFSITNKNKALPYLAQAWMENEAGNKVTSPFVVVPPLQRLEPEQASQIRVEALPQISQLPQDRESIFYFNLREIPPQSDKPNVLQIALQNKIKFFYRPKSLELTTTELINNPWQHKLILAKQGNKIIAKNPTPYYITILGVRKSNNGQEDTTFKAAMIDPFGEQALSVDPNWMGETPVLTYINDYGGRIKMQYKCQAVECNFSNVIEE